MTTPSIVENVCFTSTESFGIIKIPRSGFVTSFKLIHVSGFAKCAPDSTSYWGCMPYYPTNEVSIVIADDQGQKIVPPGAPGLNYAVPGADVTSKELNLPVNSPYEVRKGQELRLYHAEVFVGWHVGDNVGSQCVNIILSYN